MTSSMQDAHARRPSALALLGIVAPLVAAPLLTVVLVLARRPQPFASSLDNHFYFGPLIRAQSEAWLAGEMPRVVWSLGAGWTPWQSGQTGVLWPLYVVAAALSRMTGGAVDVLGASALLSLWATAAVAWFLLPRTITASTRAWLAASLAVAPAPLLIGLSWHNYLAPAPAFLAVALLATRIALDGTSRRSAIGLVVASLLFFAGSHVQMYVLGIGFIALFVVALAPDHRARGRALVWLVTAQLPLALPLIFLKLVSMHMSPDWLWSHSKDALLSRTALGKDEALRTLVAGGFWARRIGHGFFFNPLFLVFVALVLSQPRRRRWWLPLLAVSTLLLFPRFFPFADAVAVGPLAGFRWPHKVAIFVTPLTLLACALLAAIARASSPASRASPPPTTPTTPTTPSLSPGALERAGRAAARAEAGVGAALRAPLTWAVLCVLEVLVVWHASTYSSLKIDVRKLGSGDVVESARRCVAQLGIAPGTRIAVAGKIGRKTRLPLALTGLANNAAIDAGLESAHLYEPMEETSVALQHGMLSTYWRRAVDPATLRGDALAGTTRALTSWGTQVLVARSAADLGDLPGVRSCTIAARADGAATGAAGGVVDGAGDGDGAGDSAGEGAGDGAGDGAVDGEDEASAPSSFTGDAAGAAPPSTPQDALRTMFAAPLPGAIASVPSFPTYSVPDSGGAGAGGAREPFERSAGGVLLTRRPLASAPADDVDGPAPIEWQQFDDGRWRGVPQTPPAWLVGACTLIFALVIALAMLQRRSPTPIPPGADRSS